MLERPPSPKADRHRGRQRVWQRCFRARQAEGRRGLRPATVELLQPPEIQNNSGLPQGPATWPVVG
jgi:hypothetical protein